MAKYLKYIAFVILILICIGIIWAVFLRENKELTEYKEKFSNETKQVLNGDVIDQTQDGTISDEQEQQTDENKPEKNLGQSSETTTEKISDAVVGKKDVIITSETEMLNKKGQELLKEISAELDETFKTVSKTPGIVNTEELNKSLDE